MKIGFSLTMIAVIALLALSGCRPKEEKAGFATSGLIKCTESDGGKDFAVKGNVIYDNSVETTGMEDSCSSDGVTLAEWFCPSSVTPYQVESHDCTPGSCVAGACV